MLDASSAQGQAFQWIVADSSTSPCDSLAVSQRFALATLYYSTNGDEWAFNENWLSNEPVCEWFEVICFDDEETILQLNLFNNNLEGTLPWELRAISSLRGFDVFFNSLVGTIPDYFSAWPDLVLFDVENNTIGGSPFYMFDPIPPNEDTGYLMPNLRFFRLSHNIFTGGFPPEAAVQLAGVDQLWMAGNEFRGQLPTELGEFVELRKFCG